jgi:hypothetical protein
LDDTENGQPNEVTRLEKATSQLAIILSGPFPRESPKEIALLVEVIGSEPDTTSEETIDRGAVVYCASIIHRVLIRRAPNNAKDAVDRQQQFKMGYIGEQGDKHVCLGETLGPTQRWWVDRPVNPKTEFTPALPKRRPTFYDRISKVSKVSMFRIWGGNVAKTIKEGPEA